jgi:hypothetical protein
MVISWKPTIVYMSHTVFNDTFLIISIFVGNTLFQNPPNEPDLLFRQTQSCSLHTYFLTATHGIRHDSSVALISIFSLLNMVSNDQDNALLKPLRPCRTRCLLLWVSVCNEAFYYDNMPPLCQYDSTQKLLTSNAIHYVNH